MQWRIHRSLFADGVDLSSVLNRLLFDRLHEYAEALRDGLVTVYGGVLVAKGRSGVASAEPRHQFPDGGTGRGRQSGTGAAQAVEAEPADLCARTGGFPSVPPLLRRKGLGRLGDVNRRASGSGPTWSFR